LAASLAAAAVAASVEGAAAAAAAFLLRAPASWASNVALSAAAATSEGLLLLLLPRFAPPGSPGGVVTPLRIVALPSRLGTTTTTSSSFGAGVERRGELVAVGGVEGVDGPSGDAVVELARGLSTGESTDTPLDPPA